LGLSRANASDRAEIEKVLLHAPANVEGVDRSLDLTLRIEQRRVARRRGEIDAERRSVEGSAGFLDIAADRREKVSSALADASPGFVGAESSALGKSALVRGESCRIAEGEWSRRCRWRDCRSRRGDGRLRERARRAECNRCEG
jgi:hypothetical protein